MKLILTGLVLFTFTFISQSQCDYNRYRDFVFEETEAQYNITYGNAPVWYFPFLNDPLNLDIYQPLGDTLEKRPAIIWIHSGGFLTGDKGVDDMTMLCENFARKGYVTTSINYRQGFNVLSNGSAQRAVYRGVQDARAAFRYLVEFSDELNIDTSRIFVGGSSAGGFSTLHLAYLDEDERPSSTYDWPNLGCIDCEGNSYDHEVNPLGLIDLWGAIGDTIWIDPDDETPLYMAHGTEDATVPFITGPPFGVFIFDDVYGSQPISQRLDNLGQGYDLTVLEGEGHEPHGADNGTFNDPPTEFWYTMNDEITEFCLELIIPETPIVEDSLTICIGDTLYIDLPEISDTYCFHGDGQSEISTSQIQLVYDSVGVWNDSLFVENCIGAVSEPHIFTIVVNEKGCTDPLACNYNPQAECDDGSCEFITCACPYDIVVDGQINILDLLAVSSDFGCFSECTGDADGNGSVNVLDLLVISSNFGQMCP